MRRYGHGPARYLRSESPPKPTVGQSVLLTFIWSSEGPMPTPPIDLVNLHGHYVGQDDNGFTARALEGSLTGLLSAVTPLGWQLQASSSTPPH